MADYQLTDTTTVIRTRDHASIPADPGNRDWQEFDYWLATGGVPDPYVPPPEPEPPPPSPEDVVLFDHENRIRGLEGVPPLEIGEFRKINMARG